MQNAASTPLRHNYQSYCPSNIFITFWLVLLSLHVLDFTLTGLVFRHALSMFIVKKWQFFKILFDFHQLPKSITFENPKECMTFLLSESLPGASTGLQRLQRVFGVGLNFCVSSLLSQSERANTPLKSLQQDCECRVKHPHSFIGKWPHLLRFHFDQNVSSQSDEGIKTTLKFLSEGSWENKQMLVLMGFRLIGTNTRIEDKIVK